MRESLRKALGWSRRHLAAVYLCLAALAFFGVLLPLHLSLAYEEVRGRNRDQLEALERRVDVRPEGFTFAVLGESCDSRRVFEGILRNLGGDEPSFCVHLGDGVHSGDITSYAYFLKQLELYKRPLMMVAGPRELQGEGRRVFEEVFGDTYYSFTAGDCLMVVLDDRGGEGPEAEQLIWLRGELERAQSRKCRLVFMHHPLLDPEGAEEGVALRDRKTAERLLSLFEELKVDMVIASHAPGCYQGNWGNVRYLVTGGAGSRIEPTDDAHRFYNYAKISASGGDLRVEVVRTPGPASDFWDAAAFYWSLHTYGFFALWFWWDMALLVAAASAVWLLLSALRHSRWKKEKTKESGGEAD